MNFVRSLCAGSLREVMEALSAKARQTVDLDVRLEFGPSGLLRRRIEAGEEADILASADMGHPRALYEAGLSHAPRIFCANAVRIMVAPGIEPPEGAQSDPAALVSWLLAPGLRLSTSTPGADPAGDYAWRFFALAENAVPGAKAALENKAVKAVEGCGPKRENGVLIKRPVIRLFEEKRADVFIGYATTAAEAAARIAGLRVFSPPPSLAVSCPYGLALLRNASEEAHVFAQFMLSEAGKKTFTGFGFTPPQ